ncbi:MAG: hypothetical protein R3B48_10100 [Kofleriaceae bacterium]
MNRTPWLSFLAAGALGVVAGAACGGDEPGEVPGGPAANIPAQVRFSVTCGDAEPAAQVFQVVNSGTEELLVRSAEVTGGFTVTAALPITLQPGANITFSVQPPAAEVGVDRGGSVKSGVLSIDTDDPRGKTQVQLRAEVKGANLEFTDAEGQPVSAVAVVPVGLDDCGAAPHVFLRNSGNAGVTYDSATGHHTVTRVAESSELPGGESLEFSVEPDATDACVINSDLSFTVTGDVCIAPPTLTVTQTGDGGETCFCGGGGGSGT